MAGMAYGASLVLIGITIAFVTHPLAGLLLMVFGVAALLFPLIRFAESGESDHWDDIDRRIGEALRQRRPGN